MFWYKCLTFSPLLWWGILNCVFGANQYLLIVLPVSLFVIKWPQQIGMSFGTRQEKNKKVTCINQCRDFGKEPYCLRVLFFFNLFFLYSRFSLVIHFIHVSVCMSIPISQFIPPPPLSPPWCPYVWSLHLCLYFCPANQFICTIFLGSTYMR